MNILVFDAPSAVGHLVRSLLRSLGHRVALSRDAGEAEAKLNTALFDAAVLGPGGAPPELAELLEREFPKLPLVLAGVPVEIPAGGPIAAVLLEPLSARRLGRTFHRLERDRRERIARLPVTVAADGASIACRLADLTPEVMVLAGESDEFQRYFDGNPRRVDALVSGAPLRGEVLATDRGEFRRVSRVDVRVEGPAARVVLAQLLRA